MMVHSSPDRLARVMSSQSNAHCSVVVISAAPLNGVILPLAQHAKMAKVLSLKTCVCGGRSEE